MADDDYIERTKRAWEDRDKLVQQQAKPEAAEAQKDKSVVRSPTHVCLSCGQAVFPGADSLVGKRIMVLVLGILTLGIYFLIRLLRKPECPLCGSRKVVRRDSPEAQQFQSRVPTVAGPKPTAP
jgi:hypothetical protein